MTVPAEFTVPCGWISSASPVSQVPGQLRAGEPARPYSARRPSLNTQVMESGFSMSIVGITRPVLVVSELVSELVRGLVLGLRVAGQPGCRPGTLVGLPVDAGGVQAAEVLFRGQDRGVAKKVT